MRIATVKYLNALPFLHALNTLAAKWPIELIEAAPSDCSRLLKSGQVDIALIPVGAIADFEVLYVVSNYGICCNGAVRTVKLFSEYPVLEIQQIVLDPDSRSSNLLIQILCKDLWSNPNILYVDVKNEDKALKTGYLKIGDQVFNLENTYPYEFDLGESWKTLTGLGFVFAIWVSKNPIDPKLEKLIDEAFYNSIQSIREITDNSIQLDNEKLNDYFEKNISYTLDTDKKEGLNKFFELTNMYNPLQL